MSLNDSLTLQQTIDKSVAAKVNDPASSTRGALNATYVQVAKAPTGVVATDTANIQAAHDALPTTGGHLILPPGTYELTTVNITKPVRIMGAGGTSPLGLSGTQLDFKSTTADGLNVTADGVVMEDITVRNSAATTPTAGVGIHFVNGDWAHLNRVTVIGFYDCVNFDTGFYYTINDCRIYDPVRYGMYLRNTTPGQYDFGDQSITNTVFTSYFYNRNASAAVRWESGGGMKFVGNKINGNSQPTPGHGSGTTAGGGKFGVGLDWAVADGVSTVDLMVTGCSLENCTTAMVRAGLAGTTGYFSNIVITGNEIGFGYASCTGVILNGVSLGHLTNAVISDNIFSNLPNGSISASYVTGLVIGKNAHEGITGDIISLGTNVQNTDIEPQRVNTNAVVLLRDGTAGQYTNAGPFGDIRHEYVREVPATVTLSYGELWQIDVPAYGAGRYELTIAGQVSGVGSVFRKYSGYFFRDNGLVSLGAPDQNITGGASGLDVNLDTATAGTVKFQIKLPTGSTGTACVARATLRLDGAPTRVYRS